MTKLIDTIKIVLLLTLIIFSSCSSSLRSGKSYVVEDVKGTGYVIKLKGVDELFTVPKIHKIGDTIKVFRTFKESKAKQIFTNHKN